MRMNLKSVSIVLAIILTAAVLSACGLETVPSVDISGLEEETADTSHAAPADSEMEVPPVLRITEEEETEPPTIPVTEVRVIRNIEYARVDGIPLKLDMYVPDTPVMEPMPVVVFIHGGGWQTGDKYPGKAEILARRGFLGISINYRLSDVATFPAAVEDCKCAIRWVRAHAEKYGADPEKIGIWGGSAGGHLVMMLGCADETAGLEGNSGWGAYSSRVQAVCSYYGPSDFAIMGEYTERTDFTVESKFLGGTKEEIPDVYVKASPVTYVSADDPPLLMVHGDKDIVVGLKQSEAMLEAYKETGLEATLITVKNAGHGFSTIKGIPINPSIEEIEQAVLDFFVKHLITAEQ